MESCGFHSHQFGFLSSSNTELAIETATQALQDDFKYGAVLDLKSAYDRVPRDRLLALCQRTLPEALSAMIRNLLHRTTVRTKGQHGTLVASIALGVPQGDPLSPWLFSLYLDPLLRLLNRTGSTRTIGFADDVLGLATTEPALAALLSPAEDWAEGNGMSWNASKSFILCGNNPERVFQLTGHRLEPRTVVDYLGVSLSVHGVTSHRLLARLKAAQNMAYQMSRSTQSVHLTYAQKRAMAQTFILSLVSYVLYLQPFDRDVEREPTKLEKHLTSWILGIRTQWVYRARVGRALLQLPSFSTRRRIQAAKQLQKLRLLELTTDTVIIPKRKISGSWALTQLPLLRDLNMELALSSLDEDSTRNTVKTYMENQLKLDFRTAGRRRIPSSTTHSLPPALRDRNISRAAQHIAVLWYMSALIPTPALRHSLEDLKLFLEMESWNIGLSSHVYTCMQLAAKRRTATL